MYMYIQSLPSPYLTMLVVGCSPRKAGKHQHCNGGIGGPKGIRPNFYLVLRGCFMSQCNCSLIVVLFQYQPKRTRPNEY